MLQHHSMNLNIRYDAPASVWDKVPVIYQQATGWIGWGTGGDGGEPGIPYWFGFEAHTKHICASCEPSGLLFTGRMEEEEWQLWATQIKEIATRILGYPVGAPEDGYE